jgi:DnaJ-class molecular chaperone
MSAGGEIASFGDNLFEVIKAQQAATHAAYQSGFDAGYQAGMQKAMEIIDEAADRAKATTLTVDEARDLTAEERATVEQYLIDVTCTACHNVKSKCTCEPNICPKCHGRGGSAVTIAGSQAYYCNCEEGT